MQNRGLYVYITIAILGYSVLLLSACKKQRGYEGIEQSNISLGNIRIDVEQSTENILFRSGEVYKSYFAASGIQIDDSVSFIISTRSITDHDYEAGDLVSRKLMTDEVMRGIARQDINIFKNNTAKLNVVSPNVYYSGKELHVIFLKQESYDVSDIYIVRSMDGGVSWSDEVKINTQNTYHTIMNNSIVVTRTGRIIVSTAITPSISENYEDQTIVCYYSDDGGRKWLQSTKLISNTPLMEPSIGQLSSGKLLMVIRSRLGKLLFSESSDNGTTWSAIKMSHINAPASTSLLYNIGDKLALVWNNTKPGSHVFDRTPLSLSLSSDGINWSSPVTIASEVGAMYSSPAIFKFNDKWIILYNKSSNASDYDIVYKLIEIKR